MNFKEDEMQNIFDLFVNKIFELKSFYSMSSKNFDLIYSDIEKKSCYMSIGLNVFDNPYTGEPVPFNMESITKEEKKEKMLIYRNMQYQWILSSMYELFEDYIVSIYKTSCYTYNLSCLRLSDDNRDEPMQDRQLKNRIKKIILNFKKEVESIDKYEKNNKLQKHLGFEITLIEKFRHIIVHKNGKIDKLELVIQDILNSSMISGNKELEPKYIEKIKSYICQDDGLFGIIILEDIIKHCDKMNIDRKFSRIDDLLNSLIAYAFIIHSELTKYVSLKQKQQT